MNDNTKYHVSGSTVGTVWEGRIDESRHADWNDCNDCGEPLTMEHDGADDGRTRDPMAIVLADGTVFCESCVEEDIYLDCGTAWESQAHQHAIIEVNLH